MGQSWSSLVTRESGMQTDFKFSYSVVSMDDVQFLASSIKKKLSRAQINVSQNSRLSHRIDGIVEELKIMLEGGALAMRHGCFSILLARARSLVTECGGSEWVKTALTRGNNKEAYEEMHKELTKSLIKYVGFPSTMVGSGHFTTTSSPPTIELLNEDAEKDHQEMLEKLKKLLNEDAKKDHQEMLKKPKKLLKKLKKFGSRHWSCLYLGYLQGPTTSESREFQWEKISQVISDKGRDQASSYTGELDLSASYLQIPESDIDLKKRIGTGSYGDVYKAEWLGCEICLKNFPWSGGYTKEWLKQAAPLLKLRHPNVLQLVGFSPSVDDSQESKVLTEIMQGDIRSLIDRRMKGKNGKGTPFSWCMTLDIMTQVVRGLACMHENGFMHGDRVLTTNIIIKRERGNYVDARIGDFGVPVTIPVEYVHVYEPRQGDPKGAETARWMAPEVCTRAMLYSPSSDIYSFGMFCYELLTGKIPFYNFKDVAEVHSQIVAGKLRPDLPKNLDERIEHIIQQCWLVDPSSRPNAQEIVAQLENIMFSHLREDQHF